MFLLKVAINRGRSKAGFRNSAIPDPSASLMIKPLEYCTVLVTYIGLNPSIFSMLLNCYGVEETEEVSCFCIYETGHDVERKCDENEKPLTIQSGWTSSSGYHKFVLRKATRTVANQVKANKVPFTTSLSLLQFPEETCVDESDRLCWGYASHDSASSTCSEVENAFYHPSGNFDSYSEFSVHDPFLAPSISPTQPPLTYSSLCSTNPEIILPKSAFLPLIRTGKHISLFNQRVIKKSSFGSVTSATTSEESDNFFYI